MSTLNLSQWAALRTASVEEGTEQAALIRDTDGTSMCYSIYYLGITLIKSFYTTSCKQLKQSYIFFINSVVICLLLHYLL